MGPLVHQWCMRYESVHGYLKRKATVACNFKNMPFTLAMQYQYRLSDNLVNDSFMRKFTSPGKVKHVDLRNVDAEFVKPIQSTADVQAAAVKTCTSIVHNGQCYKPGQIVLANVSDAEVDEQPKFCQIKYIVELNGDWYFAVSVLKTVAFSTHLHAFRVEMSNDAYLVKIGGLLDYHPLNMYKYCGALLVRLRYHVNSFF